MSAFVEFAPAKINLYLHVLGRRADGYHLLESLVVFAGAADALTVEPAGALSLEVSGPFGKTLQGEPDNLVLRAARALAEATGIRAHGHLRLDKHLPVASGIGGGSADAAAALRLLRRFWKVTPDPDTLFGIARGLGADVPVCMGCKPMVMSGIGEQLEATPDLPELGIVLINPGVALSTPSVFRARSGEFSKAARPGQGAFASLAALVDALRSSSNDLQSPAVSLAPAVADVLHALEAEPDCLLARMSGSGATCFGLFQTKVTAQAAAARISRTGWWTWGGELHRGS